jgi:hypothetical protein
MLALPAMLQWAGIGGHQWLPDLVRLAVAGDDMPMAQTAAQACEAEAAAETRPARAAAASLRCRGLLEADPAPPATLSRITGRPVRQWRCLRLWRTWPSCWPNAGRKTRPGPP